LNTLSNESPSFDLETEDIGVLKKKISQDFTVFTELPLRLQQNETLFEMAKFECMVTLINELGFELDKIKKSRLNEDWDIALVALMCTYALEHIFLFSDELKRDDEIYDCFKKKFLGSMLFGHNIYLLAENPELFPQYQQFFEQVERLGDDEEILYLFLKESHLTLSWASDRLKSDPQIVLFAIKKHWRAMTIANLNIDQNEEIFQIVKAQLLSNLNQLTNDPFAYQHPNDYHLLTPRLKADPKISQLINAMNDQINTLR
jgi:hypothetical protein